MANTLSMFRKMKASGKKLLNLHNVTLQVGYSRDNWLKDQENETFGKFFTNEFPAFFHRNLSKMFLSPGPYFWHCYNPNAGLVRQKAGMEALIVFIGSPVTGYPVLDIAWQHQNHEKATFLITCQNWINEGLFLMLALQHFENPANLWQEPHVLH